MTYFLTSSPCVLGDEALTSANGFLDKIKSTLPDKGVCLFVASSPDDIETTERHGNAIRRSFAHDGIEFSDYIFLDSRNESMAALLVDKADLIILAGGHVPTQNEFFTRIGLRGLMQGFDGVVMGISAGTMNSADTVYAHPERPGEATDPNFEKFIPGLGLTKTMVLPHYQMIKDDVLDGLRLFEDVTYPDSMGREFYALPDGSYLYGKDGKEWLCGEAWLIKDGGISPFSKDGDIIEMK